MSWARGRRCPVVACWAAAAAAATAAVIVISMFPISFLPGMRRGAKPLFRCWVLPRSW